MKNGVKMTSFNLITIAMIFLIILTLFKLFILYLDFKDRRVEINIEDKYILWIIIPLILSIGVTIGYLIAYIRGI